MSEKGINGRIIAANVAGLMDIRLMTATNIVHTVAPKVTALLN